MNQEQQEKWDEVEANIIEVVCEACLPYVCAHWDLKPKERIEQCKPLREWLARIFKDIYVADPDQSKPDWQHYIWPSSRLDNEMANYQCGKIDKTEHHKRARLIFDEELNIYKKAQQDMSDFKRVIPKEVE